MVAPRLFDSFSRTDDSPSAYAEPAFVFLNRSATPWVEKVREMLEAWFDRYPAHEQPDLRGRFRAPDDSQHRAAFFELFLHELLMTLGCSVTIHPPAKEGRCPDFLVESAECPFYLEAVLATDESAEETAARARMNRVYDALNRMVSPNFFVMMKMHGAPKGSPPASKIRSFLEARFRELDPEVIVRRVQANGLRDLPTWRFEAEGWTIDFSPWPKSPDARGKPGLRPISVQTHGVQVVTPHVAIREAILSKAGRYGDLELPYVVAVNALGDFVDHDAIVDALLGEEQITFQETAEGSTPPRLTRKLQGAWTTPSAPRYTRVSAVLVFWRLLPWTTGRAFSCLYHNPWAQKSYACALTRLQSATLKGGDMEYHPGQSIAAILNPPT